MSTAVMSAAIMSAAIVSAPIVKQASDHRPFMFCRAYLAVRR